MTRTIRTATELDALPWGAIVARTILGEPGQDWHKRRDGMWLGTDGDVWTAETLALASEHRYIALSLVAPAPAPSVVPEAAVEALRAVIDEALADALGDTFSPSVMDDLTRRVHAALTAALPPLTAAPSATRDEVARAVGAGIRGTTDGDLIDADADIPAGEAVRLATDALLARFTITPKEDR